jgi:hypothetical protein
MTDDVSLALTEAEKRALIALLKRTLEYDRFPLAPRLAPLKSIWQSSNHRRPLHHRCGHCRAAGHRASGAEGDGKRKERSHDAVLKPG